MSCHAELRHLRKVAAAAVVAIVAAFALAACQDTATANDAAPSAITVDAVGGGK